MPKGLRVKVWQSNSAAESESVMNAWLETQPHIVIYKTETRLAAGHGGGYGYQSTISLTVWYIVNDE